MSEVVTNTNDEVIVKTSLWSNRYFYLVTYAVLYLFFVFWGLINVDGGFFGGGLGKFFEALSGSYEYGTDHETKLLDGLLYGALLYLSLVLSLVFQKNETVQRFAVYITAAFTFFFLRFFFITLSNLFILYMGIFFVSLAYYNYLKHGEIRSLFGNPIVVFALRRSFAIIPMFLAIAAITFFGVNFIGDPVEIATARVRYNKEAVADVLLQRYGLKDDQGNLIPIWERFWNYLVDFVHFDLGVSYETLIPVTQNLEGFIVETLKMQIAALVLAFTLSVIIGVLAAYYHRSLADSAISALALLGLSMPIFVSGILAIIIFGGTGLDWFPVSGAYTIPNSNICADCGTSPRTLFGNLGENWTDFGYWGLMIKVWFFYTMDNIIHLILPVLTLTFATMATFSRLTRSTMLEVMRQDYILAARANGLSEREVVGKHALRNVLLPLITFLGISIGTILVGAPITETVFSYPGLGQKFILSLFTLDMPILMGVTMIITLMILVANLLTDIAYSFLDPRITL